MKIVVHPSGWGTGSPLDVKAVLEDVARYVSQPLRAPLQETVHVNPTASEEDDPMTCLRRGPGEPPVDGPITILLAARGHRWAQFAYQFGHELCHVLTPFEDLERSPNNWFHEAICELAALVTLRRMTEGWPASAPLDNWSSGSISPGEYFARHQKPEMQLPQGVTLSDWLAASETQLRENRYLRTQNAVVANELLPIFESEPAGWNATRKFPRSESLLMEYLHEWSAEADDDRPFVERIIRRFEE